MVFHRPVMVEETARLLITKTDGTYVDLTCGGGGHLKFISGKLTKGARLIGIDRDAEAVEAARENLKTAGQKIEIINNTYNQFGEILKERGINKVTGILIDSGLSSHQIDKPERGFSFMTQGPLDMRMGAGCTVSAKTVINEYSRERLKLIFREYGEERKAAAIADAICHARKHKKISTTTELVELFRNILPKKNLNSSLARMFQAVRIEVNNELEQLKETLPRALEFLDRGGRLVILSYHSLEDRIVKNFFTTQAKGCICPPELPVCVCGKQPAVNILTRKVIKPAQAEIEENVRARSARLRAAEKIA